MSCWPEMIVTSAIMRPDAINHTLLSETLKIYKTRRLILQTCSGFTSPRYGRVWDNASTVAFDWECLLCVPMAAPVHAGIDWAIPAPPKPVSRWSYDIIRPLIRLSIVLKWKNINFLPSEAYGMICGCYYPARVWREWTNKNPERETERRGKLVSYSPSDHLRQVTPLHTCDIRIRSYLDT